MSQDIKKENRCIKCNKLVHSHLECYVNGLCFYCFKKYKESKIGPENIIDIMKSSVHFSDNCVFVFDKLKNIDFLMLPFSVRSIE